VQKMTGFKCEKCGKMFYPKHARCPRCGSLELKEIDLGNECTLMTYTKLFAVPEGVEQIPLLLGIVEFKNGVRALGQIVAEEVEIGATLQPVWGPLRKVHGKTVSGFKFEPVKRKLS